MSGRGGQKQLGETGDGGREYLLTSMGLSSGKSMFKKKKNTSPESSEIVRNFVNYTSVTKPHYNDGCTVLNTPETTDLCILNR